MVKEKEDTDDAEEDDEKKPKGFVVKHVPTETQPVIVNSKNQDEQYDIYAALAKIMNEVASIKKRLD